MTGSQVHMLDIECFTYLNRALESSLAPIVIFATNRGMATVRGTEIVAPHGIPVDLLDRLLIIRTLPYSTAEITQILLIRAQTEGITVDDDAVPLLADIGSAASLRYACRLPLPTLCLRSLCASRYATQLLTPGNILRRVNAREKITRDEIEEIRQLFVDAKTSARVLQEQSARYLS